MGARIQHHWASSECGPQLTIAPVPAGGQGQGDLSHLTGEQLPSYLDNYWGCELQPPLMDSGKHTISLCLSFPI